MEEDQLSDADLWELKVSQGMPKDQATAYVRGRVAGGTFEPAPKTGPDVSQMSGQVGNILQGASLGFSDELAALVQAIPSLIPGGESPRESFSRNLEEEQAPIKAYQKEHPVASTAGQLLGAAATGRGLPKLGGPLVEGLAYGGAAGAGMADGGLRERAEAGGKGALVGGLLGPAAAKLIPAIGKAGGHLADIIPGIRSRIAPALQTPRVPNGAELRMTGPGATDAPLISTLDDRALEKIVQAANRAGVTADDLAESVAATEKPVTVMEAIGQPARRLGRAVNTVPSEGSAQMGAALRTRQAGQEERVIEDLMQRTGLKRQSAVRSIDQMAEERSAEALRNYAPVYRETVDDPSIGRFLTKPAFRKAYERARNIAQYEDGALPPLDDLIDPMTGDLRAPISVRTLDRIKRGLDDVLAVGSRSPLDSGGLGNEELSVIRSVKNDFLKAIDEKVPKYAEARSAFAGKSAMIRAMDEGRKLFSMSPDEAEKLLSKMGASEVEAWRKGALDAVSEMIEGVNTSHDITARRPLAENTRNRRRLRLLFRDGESFQRFQDAIKTEAEMAATLRFTTGGSNTADKLADLADLAGVDVSAIMEAASHPTGAIAAVIGKLAKSGAARHMSGRTEELADALAPQLTAGVDSRHDLDELIRRLREIGERMERSAESKQAVRRGVTGATGGLLQ